MLKLNDIKIKPKLIGSFLLAGLLPLLVIGWFLSQQAGDALMEKSFQQLSGVRSIKTGQIKQFFAEREGDMGVLVETVSALRQESFNKLEAVLANKKTALETLKAQWFIDIESQKKRTINTLGLEQYQYFLKTGYKSPEYTKYTDIIDNFIKISGYYDYFVISESGRVVHTQAMEADYKTDLVNGPYKDSGLAKAYQRAIKGETVFIDFAPYAPSNNEPAAFLATPIIRAGKISGVVALQISMQKIMTVMSERRGLGTTGEAYLVGTDKLMRSDSFLDPVNHTVKASFANPVKGKVDTEAVNQALAGNDGSKVIIDYNGNPVLSVYSSVKIADVTWVIIAEIDVAEAFSPVDKEGNEYYKKYIEKYGYYDLFLFNPNGFCFYTAAREADYQTNFQKGKYADSNLGQLFRQIMANKKFGLVDFSPYAPSNNEPAAFIGQPIVYDDKVEVVVALQLSLDAINTIMQQREGMGKTGETYLVGSDKLMRSDSFLDPKGHSVKASFAGNVSDNGVDTEAVQKALQGETGVEIVTDYNGNPVLSAYTPLTIGDTTWALMAEIDEAEVRQPVRTLLRSIVFTMLISGVIIALFAVFSANQIAAPLRQAVDFAKLISTGDLTARIDNKRKDEIGILISALDEMKNGLTKTIEDIISGAKILASSSTELSAVSSQMAANSEQTNGRAESVAVAAEELSSNMDSVAAATEETSVNISMVASAAEEMSATITEVSSNTERTRSITEKAVEQSDNASGQINELGEAAKEIGKVTDTIKDISKQTNLLALNATIEAARAGEAGKGFAVVANEIKDLAQQTSEATAEISAKIIGIQDASLGSVTEITQITGIINEINENVSTVALAVKEQANATEEIASNVSQASIGIQEVNENVAQASIVTSEVAQSITEVSQSSGEINDSSKQLSISAGELSALSEQLTGLVNRFTV